MGYSWLAAVRSMYYIGPRVYYVPFLISFVWFRLQFEARNQKKEAKEIAVIQAMKRQEEEKTKERAQAVL